MKKKLLLIFLLAFIFPIPVHAYAGPGLGLGAIIIFLTVILSILVSFFLDIKDFFMRVFSKNKRGKELETEYIKGKSKRGESK